MTVILTFGFHQSMHNRSKFQPHVLDQLLETGMLFSLLVVSRAQKTEIMCHYQVPFFELVQHLKFFDFHAFDFMDAIIVAE